MAYKPHYGPIIAKYSFYPFHSIFDRTFKDYFRYYMAEKPKDDSE